MATHNVLVPSNFMVNDDKSLDFIINNYSQLKDVQITLFHAYTPFPDIDVRNNPIMERVVSNMAYLEPFLKEREKELHKSKEKLIQAGFRSSHVHCLFTPLRDEVAEDIIRLVREKNFDTIVMNRNPNKVARFFFKSVSKKVSERLGKSVTVVVLS